MYQDLIKSIPVLILSFIPGFIAIGIRERYRFQNKLDHFHLSLYSIVYSFLIDIIYSLLLGFCNISAPKLSQILEYESVKNASHIFIGILFGCILVKLPDTKLAQKIRKMMNPHYSPEDSVWIKAMQYDTGAWASVYLKNGMVYTGAILGYTDSSNIFPKEILLGQYRLCLYNVNITNDSSNFYLSIEDKTNDPDAKVYLSGDDICSIQIHP